MLSAIVQLTAASETPLSLRAPPGLALFPVKMQLVRLMLDDWALSPLWTALLEKRQLTNDGWLEEQFTPPDALFANTQLAKVAAVWDRLTPTFVVAP